MDTPASTQLPDPIIITNQAGSVRIHTMIAAFTDGNIANATHIIESKHTLVLIDSQFLRFYAMKFREYADTLRKPIERLYLSHRHPDHWFGVGSAFSDIPTTSIYGLPETVGFIGQHGEESRQDHLKKLGDQAPDKIVVPGSIVQPGVDTIDGVTYVFDRAVDTEIDFHLTITLPGNAVMILQDLIYSGTHLYLTPHFDRWIRVLSAALTSDYDLFLAGHGLPADKSEVARNIEYLASANGAMESGLTSDAFKAFLIARYPERKCPAIFDIYLPRLFSGASQY
jgi:glyoxylase-like metal-dependent hydrolase (beta-lactamase superfamily II)